MHAPAAPPWNLLFGPRTAGLWRRRGQTGHPDPGPVVHTPAAVLCRDRWVPRRGVCVRDGGRRNLVSARAALARAVVIHGCHPVVVEVDSWRWGRWTWNSPGAVHQPSPGQPELWLPGEDMDTPTANGRRISQYACQGNAKPLIPLIPMRSPFRCLVPCKWYSVPPSEPSHRPKRICRCTYAARIHKVQSGGGSKVRMQLQALLPYRRRSRNVKLVLACFFSATTRLTGFKPMSSIGKKRMVWETAAFAEAPPRPRVPQAEPGLSRALR